MKPLDERHDPYQLLLLLIDPAVVLNKWRSVEQLFLNSYIQSIIKDLNPGETKQTYLPTFKIWKSKNSER